jgi:hypothetical protein
MDERAVAFGHLLERERQAALHAKLDVLTEVQEQKRALLAEMHDAKLGNSDISALIERAHENIGLIRHLVVCLRGCLGSEAEPTYNAHGERALLKDRGLRGVL